MIHGGEEICRGAPYSCDKDQREQIVQVESGERKCTYHPSAFGGVLTGIGSVDVNLRQWNLQSAGWCTISCHFLETYQSSRLSDPIQYQSTRNHLTDSTPTSSFTLRSFKILNARSGARFPTTSNVDLAYFSRSRI